MKVNSKKLLAFSGLFALLIGVISPLLLTPQQVSADYATRCNGATRLNRTGCHGYFKGTNYYNTSNGIQGQNIIDCTRGPNTCSGSESVNNAIPSTVNTANELIAWAQKYLFNSGGTGYNYNKAGAAFIVDAMLGRYGTDYGTTAAGIAYAQANFARWSDAVRFYEAQGWITWNDVRTIPTGYVNSMHACWPSIADCTRAAIGSHDSQDFAFYRNPGPEASHIIVFHNPNGSTFEIRRECANLLGSISGVTMPTYNLSPTVSATVNGAAGTVAQVGDTVKFTYVVSNSGGTSAGTACNTYANTYVGQHAATNPAVAGGPAGPNPGCPRNFPGGATTVATETIVLATGNQTICRSLFVNPYRYGLGALGREACVTVANQPYLKVFGGDIAAGGGLKGSTGTCTNNTNASVTAWNKGTAGGYAGAGAQYAVYALDAITYFASALGNVGGAPTPTGLSFRNTSTSVGTGNFGGDFGTATCIPDYYGRKPATVNALPANVSSMTTGAYGRSGATNLSGGNVSSNEKISVYIDGDVYITSDISYAGAFNSSQVPLFQLVVRGNIYISKDVHRLDGVYIAQKNGVNGGTIYTCATGMAPLTLTNGAFYNDCNSKLTINGAFVANSVEFLRTLGTVSSATAGETSDSNGAGNSAGEVFNFNPMLWMTQPAESDGGVDNYDAITSLPPVL